MKIEFTNIKKFLRGVEQSGWRISVLAKAKESEKCVVPAIATSATFYPQLHRHRLDKNGGNGDVGKKNSVQKKNPSHMLFRILLTF